MRHHRRKLLSFIAWIGAEGIVLWLFGALIIVDDRSSSPGFWSIRTPASALPGPLRIYVEGLIDPAYILFVAAGLIAIVGLQGVFLLPVRAPAVRQSEPTSLRASLAVVGLSFGALAAGLVLGVINASNLWAPERYWIDDWFWIGWSTLLAVWIVSTPLLIAFSRRSLRETYLAKLATILFVGTVVELLAVVPINVIARRRSGCYSGEPSTFSLTACLAVGVFALGPGILLVALARRRRRWYAGHCPVCGYDMGGLPHAVRCPECGAGWKAEPA